MTITSFNQGGEGGGTQSAVHICEYATVLLRDTITLDDSTSKTKQLES